MQRFTSLNVCGSLTYISWSSTRSRCCLISWRLFDGWMLYWRYWFSVSRKLTWRCIRRSLTYISWSSDFVLYLEDYFMDKCNNWDISSMWCKDLPHKIYVGQLLTFHGPVILSYVLKTFWWRNLYIAPVFQDLAILNYFPISACGGLLKFDMSMFVNVARLGISQLFTQCMRWGHPCTLDTFLVVNAVSILAQFLFHSSKFLKHYVLVTWILTASSFNL